MPSTTPRHVTSHGRSPPPCIAQLAKRERALSALLAWTVVSDPPWPVLRRHRVRPFTKRLEALTAASVRSRCRDSTKRPQGGASSPLLTFDRPAAAKPHAEALNARNGAESPDRPAFSCRSRPRSRAGVRADVKI